MGGRTLRFASYVPAVVGVGVIAGSLDGFRQEQVYAVAETIAFSWGLLAATVIVTSLAGLAIAWLESSGRAAVVRRFAEIAVIWASASAVLAVVPGNVVYPAWTYGLLILVPIVTSFALSMRLSDSGSRAAWITLCGVLVASGLLTPWGAAYSSEAVVAAALALLTLLSTFATHRIIAAAPVRDWPAAELAKALLLACGTYAITVLGVTVLARTLFFEAGSARSGYALHLLQQQTGNLLPWILVSLLPIGAIVFGSSVHAPRPVEQ